MRQLKIKAGDGLLLSVAIFEHEDPRALVQIIHGAAEHKERYYDFARYLNDNGFAVILSDNRGNGGSIGPLVPLGHMEGPAKVVEDQVMLTRYLKDMYPEKELCLIGHSLGSILARIYLQKYDREINRLVLSGTAHYIRGAGFAALVTKIVCAIRQDDTFSFIPYKLSGLGMDSKNLDWLSSSKANIEEYKKDRLCGFRYCNSGYLTLFEGCRQLHQRLNYLCMNPALPILSVTGQDDPVVGGERGLSDSLHTLKKIGYQDVSSIVYPGMKHEILNEDDKTIVYADILSFLTEKQTACAKL